MNRGILLKTIREVWVAAALFGLGLFVLQALLAYVFPNVLGEVAGPLLQIPFVKNMLQALLGTRFEGDIGPTILGSLAWVHPVALTLLGAHEVVICTRMPAGEIDRGTMDVLLALPVTRWQMYLSESVVWAVSGALIILLGLAGCLVGGLAVAPEARTGIDHLLIIICNLYCLYIAVGGLSYLVSAMSERRGQAMGVIFAVVLASFLLNFLAQYWELADRALFLSFLNYYRPLSILQADGWPVGDMLILIIIGAFCWTVGGVVFSRRDIHTV